MERHGHLPRQWLCASPPPAVKSPAKIDKHRIRKPRQLFRFTRLINHRRLRADRPKAVCREIRRHRIRQTQNERILPHLNTFFLRGHYPDPPSPMLRRACQVQPVFSQPGHTLRPSTQNGIYYTKVIDSLSTSNFEIIYFYKSSPGGTCR